MKRIHISMKRRTALLLTCLLFNGLLYAQQADTLTNSAIIRMEKANLDDELIIDVIRGSVVNFDLSETGIRKLRDENVSLQVIGAMESAQPKALPAQKDESIKPSTEPEKRAVKEEPIIQEKKPVENPVSEISTSPEKPTPPNTTPATTKETPSKITPSPAVKPVRPASGNEAYGYVAPLAELVKFYENEFDVISKTIANWDVQIKLSLNKINDLDRLILVTENELRTKKNKNSESYNTEINTLIQRLSGQRNSYKQLKTDLIATGDGIIKNAGELMKERSSALKNTYGDVSSEVRAVNCDPSRGANPVRINSSSLVISDNINSYIAPATELLYWYQNSIGDIRQITELWNSKVEAVIEKDVELAGQLSPLLTKMDSYKADPKLYKTEISALKKQISAKEKERKQIADQMENDAKELSAHLKTVRTEIQKTYEERFTDIMNNINYSFKERLKI